MSGKLFSDEDAAFARCVARLVACNPFAEERVSIEREALGVAYVDDEPAWNLDPVAVPSSSNIARLLERGTALTHAVADDYLKGKGRKGERDDYLKLVHFVVFHRYLDDFDKVMAGEENRRGKTGGLSYSWAFYRSYSADLRRLLGAEESALFPHLFACCFQIRRAFHHIFRFYLGRTRTAVELRQRIWESIFTHDLWSYQESLFSYLRRIPTLITGESGTGKEVVARAIGLSQYIPFDPERLSFGADFREAFYPVNLTALSPTVIESELFGHRRGAFTGALEDRVGYFEAAGDYGTVFLDEIGETTPEIQVKLLRVLQSRTFNRLGDVQTYRFDGKLIAATNRNLVEAQAEGRFREDLFYRIRADVVRTPSLRELTEGSADELAGMVQHIAVRTAGEERADELGKDFLQWHKAHRDYSWPGNFRELEQAVRSILIRRDYIPESPPRMGDAGSGRDELETVFADLSLPLEDLIRKYVTAVYRREGSYEGTARVLGVDRRTVRKYSSEES